MVSQKAQSVAGSGWRRKFSFFGAGFVFSLLLLPSLSATTGGRPLLLPPQAIAASSSQPVKDLDARELELGKPIERELAGGQAHSYRVALASAQYLRVMVDQRGVDVVVAVFEPDGNKVAETSTPTGAQGPEVVSLVAETSGAYRLEVRPLKKSAPVGRYEIALEELRAASPQDKQRATANRYHFDSSGAYFSGSADSLKRALAKYEEALANLPAEAARGVQGETLDNKALLHLMLGELSKALEGFEQALPIWQASNDTSREALTLLKIGDVYRKLGDKHKGLDHFDRALRKQRQAGDRWGEAATLTYIGITFRELGEPQKALDYLNQAQSSRQAAGDSVGEAFTCYHIASCYGILGEWDKALQYYNRAVVLNQAADDLKVRELALDSISGVYESLGENQKALDQLSQALMLIRGQGYVPRESSLHSQIARLYYSLGDKQKSLYHYTQSLKLGRAIGYSTGGLLAAIGRIYSSMGEEQQAFDYFKQALVVYLADLDRSRALANRQMEAATLNSIAWVYHSTGEWQKALDYYGQMLALHKNLGSKGNQAYTLKCMGEVYAKSGDHQKALEHYNEALPLFREVGNRVEEALTLNNLGLTYSSLGARQKALEHFGQALRFWRAAGNKSEEAALTYQIARAERDSGNLIEAHRQIKAALEIFESLRAKLDIQELRASYLASTHEYYQLSVDILMRLHQHDPTGNYDAAALEASERARGRMLLETLVEGRANIRQGVEPTLLERERQLQQQLTAKADRLLRLVGGKHTEEQLTAAKGEIEALRTEYQQVQAQVRATSPRYAALTQPAPLRLAEIQKQVLDADTLLLEYSLGHEHSYLWAITPDSIASHELPKRAEVEAAARRVYDLLTARNRRLKYETADERRARVEQADRDFPQAARALSQMLLGPVAAQLKDKRLLVVGDGALQYVPFAALPLPIANHSDYVPLTVNHEIVSLPSASTLAVLRKEIQGRKPAPKSLLVLADPVFDATDDRLRLARATKKTANEPASVVQTRREMPTLESELERSTRQVDSANETLRMPRLPFTRREAEEIASLVPRASHKIALDFAANRATATSQEISQYRHVHFATHGLLNSQHPELSGLVLSLVDEQGRQQDGFLRAHEIYNLEIPAELVVLSGCRTGLGKEVRGEGLVGLTRAFMYAGAARVLVSLWGVNDEVTAELMTRFYRGMLGREKLTPAAALRAARASMWRDKRWQSPYYWAAFILQGEPG